MERQRLRDLGIPIGTLEPGPANAITDVAGVHVGQVTLIEDEPHAVRSGVTVVVPHDGDTYAENCFAAAHVLNGCGEMTGLVWLDEFGRLVGPLALTGTHSVGAAQEGLIRAELQSGSPADFKLPVVSETDDSWLNEAETLPVRPDHVLDAIAVAGPEVREGNHGGGTGMNCHAFKGGTGTASRHAEVHDERYTVGILLQANHGRRERLSLDGIPVGRSIPVSEVPAPWDETGGEQRVDGSIVIVVATNAPLLPHQCRRLAQRATLGIARTGGVGEPGSGDIALAFSTGNRVPQWDTTETATLRMLPDAGLTPLFDASVEATEEAIWNALCMAETMTGREGRTSHAIPLDPVQTIVGRYKAVEP